MVRARASTTGFEEATQSLTSVVAQHIEGAADLRLTRSILLRAPYINLFLLSRHDELVRAHLDGLAVAGDVGYEMAQKVLEESGVGQIFVLAISAIERRDREQIDRLLALLDTVSDSERALISAFGWVSAKSLRGVAAMLLGSADPRRRSFGMAACVAHRVDPGPTLAKGIEDPDERLRARALRTAGQLGKTELLHECLAHIPDSELSCHFRAACSGVLLSGSLRAAEALESIALNSQLHGREALRLLMLSLERDRARALVRELAADGGAPRKAIQAIGWSGDTGAINWLLLQMEDDRLARAAGEAFSMITGADLVRLQLERIPPATAEGDATVGAKDENVALDEDEGLPWPDVPRVQAWWEANGFRMPTGVRCFMGAAADEAQCQRVLREGTQRQRAVAALLLVLMQPGRVLFNIAAPAWRQQRWLAKSS